ncbi:MAG: hypothetical protein IKH60_05450 [Bacteroidales bacterium]|nr:hypothetical protein [Bacteroidales bacterium]
MNRLFTIAAAALLAMGTLHAQAPAETKLYNKTLKKPSVKAYDKFLKKYPSSVYSIEIRTLKDSTLFAAVDQEDAAAVEAFAAAHPDSPIADQVEAVIARHNTSPLTREEALAALRALAPSAADAVGYRRANRDYALGLAAADGALALYRGSLGADGAWTLADTPAPERYTLDSKLSDCRLDGPVELVEINGKNLLSFNYINSADNNKNIEYVASLYDPEDGSFTHAMFYGRDMSGKDGLKVEGQCPEALSTLATPENAWLLNRINSDPRLVPIAKADALTDDSIAWWLEKNPNAETNASRLNFGALDEESSLVAGFKVARSRDKDSSKSFTAAMMDIRDYTVIVAYSKTYKNYILVWCEPVCKDKNRDKLLNNIYFEDDTNLALFYYKGRTTFKNRINLANRTIRR